MGLLILQSHVPHYREEFFKLLSENVPVTIYCYSLPEKARKLNFKKANVTTKKLGSFSIGPFLFYSPTPFLKTDVKEIVLPLDFKHIITWVMLFTKWIHKKRVILWGHGISVKRYLREEKKPSRLLSQMMRMADKIWLYTEKELEIWKEYMPNLDAVSLDNTVAVDTNSISIQRKGILRKKYNLDQPIVLIFCARFNTIYRRTDLLLEAIHKLDQTKFCFVIIGDGPEKPDFSSFNNVHDFGAVYDKAMKEELFAVADLYYQPGWTGLSIVEAMAYGKPVLTFKRSDQIKQCVEYTYIKNGHNGLIFDNFENFLEVINKLARIEIDKMGENAMAYVKNELSIDNMVRNAYNSLDQI